MEQEKIHQLAVFYYSRKDVQEAIFQFCRNRETVPRYYEGFGKRPDSFQYPGDIIQQVNRGATSFHCSEELWENPLSISTELGKEQFNELRLGWDLIIDIDCKWFDYAKIAAKSIINSLKISGIRNIGLKFSGGKGFHILVPWKSFPEEINNIKVKDMFPEYPRIICEYLKTLSRDFLEKEISETSEHKKLSGMKGIKCNNCGNMAESLKEISYYCPNCKIQEQVKIKEDKARKCAQCRKEMIKKNEQEFFICKKCNLNSKDNPGNFSSSIDIFSILGLDLVLVSPRHLFRCPYSLHEKTGFSSVVLSEQELENFQPKDADALKIKIRNFYPEAEKNEAKNLLISALEWNGEKSREKQSREKKQEIKPQNSRGKKSFEEINVDKSSIKYPPTIKKILEGMDDGKKRALFVLLNFFCSLNFTKEETEKKLDEWNKKNKSQLKEGYIKAQIEWTFKQKKMLPPNYDKPYYKEIGLSPDDEEIRLKNPVSYVIRKSKWEKKK